MSFPSHPAAGWFVRSGLLAGVETFSALKARLAEATGAGLEEVNRPHSPAAKRAEVSNDG